jgi:hypothetical protein
VAVTVNVEVATAAAEVAVNFNVQLPLPGAAMLLGAKLAETPFCSPLTERPIAALNPFAPAVVKVIEADPPRARLAPVAPGDNVKLGTGDTVRLIV